MALYPAYFIVIGLVLYFIGYQFYAKWFDKNIIESEPSRTTPAHMYMDGAEFFPASRYILFGFQFKTITGLGPLLGPFLALAYGWLPALLWILLGNFFIGWVHDYSSIAVSVKEEGKSHGPLTYEIISPRARTILTWFIFIYLLMVCAVFILFGSLFLNVFPATILPTLGLFGIGIAMGWMLYKLKMDIVRVTLIGIVSWIIIFFLGSWLFRSPEEGGISWAGHFEVMLVLTIVLVFLGAVLPIWSYTQPSNYLAFYMAYAFIIMLAIGALLTPILPTPLPVLTEAKEGYPVIGDLFAVTDGVIKAVWPLMFVILACGAISGWHGLVSSSGSAKQVDSETDMVPVGAGSMLSEGMLALVALSSYVVVTRVETIWAGAFVGATVRGAVTILDAILPGGPFYVTTFVAFTFILFTTSVTQVAVRFCRYSLAEVTGEVTGIGPLVKNTYIGAFIVVLIAGSIAYWKAHEEIWMLFGGSNQLLAGLTLMLVSIWLARRGKSAKYTGIPAIFMIVTTIFALLVTAWNAFTFARMAETPALFARWGHSATFTRIMTSISGTLAIILVILALFVIRDAWESYKAAVKGEVVAEAAPAEAGK
ncbi:MAG: carbon starvation protein A [Candidatus Heimdallarchaeota archaeon]